MNRTPYLVIGAGAAALACIRGIRSRDRDGAITLVAAESRLCHRPLLPYWLEGKTTDAQMEPVGEGFFAANGVAPMLGTRVERIDCAARAAVLEGGGTVPFERAFIGLGGRPIVPPGLRLDGTEGIETLSDWESARRVRGMVDGGHVTRAVVVGGGFMGLKAAEALARLGVSVGIVELGSYLLGAALDARAATMARSALEAHGIGVRCGVGVESVRREADRVTAVRLSDGSELPCELVLVAVGMAPDLAPVAHTPIATDRAIIVDEHLQTSVPGIYAAGDAARSGERRPVPTLVEARRMGAVAGFNMAGGERVFRPGVPMNATDICGLACIAIGTTRPDGDACEVLVHEDAARSAYRKIVLCRNRCVGAILMGDVEGAGVLARLVREGIDVSGFRGLLRDGTPDPALLPPAYWHGAP